MLSQQIFHIPSQEEKNVLCCWLKYSNDVIRSNWSTVLFNYSMFLLSLDISINY